MEITVNESGGGITVTVKLPKEFDFHAHKEFRDTHKNSKTNTKYILDFAQTEHMDSSALGMLLLMREELGNDSAKVKLVNCRDNIKSLLEMASFHQLFEVV